MINLDGQINRAESKEVVAPLIMGPLGSARGNVFELHAELATPSKEKVELGLMFGPTMTRKLAKLNNNQRLINKRIEIIFE